MIRVNQLKLPITHTGEELENIVVYCRCPYIDDYFGGLAYRYEVENIPAYGTAEVEAIDCILGEAEVVRIVIGE